MGDNALGKAGYACSYVPVEIILAAGFKAERLIPEGRSSDAEGLIHPNTCCYVKNLLSHAAKGAFSDHDVVILANSCDAMRKLFDLWNARVDKPVALFMDIPKKRDQGSIDLFSSGLRRLALRLEKVPGGSEVTGEGLNEAIRQVNKVRSSWMDVFSALKDGRDGFSGAEVFSLMQENTGLKPGALSDTIADYKRAHPGRTSAKNGPRILIMGNILNKAVLVSMIEAAGAKIVGFNTCFGMRHHELMVEEDKEDPFDALARRYLKRPSCARMMGIADQIDRLRSDVAGTMADGVIISCVKFCDNLSYNVPLFQETVKSTGARCLVLENDYEFSDSEKTRIKVEAFLEMLG
ncbi:MAG TPA: 2-hydroxyacyl-CoA dehydratase family protein [Desulfomonilia bacterium]|nr:2-hydroxyacyl-CoA dehydratase family protein [Desulfomonilia bacterium]